MGLWVYIGQTCSLLSLLESPCVSSSINGYGFSCWAVTWGPAAKCPDPTGDDRALTRALKLVSSSWLASSLILLVGQHYQDQLYPFIFLTGSLHTSKPARSTQVSVCRGCFPPLLCAVIRAGPQLWCNSSTSAAEWGRCLCQEPLHPQLYGDAFSPKKWWLETASLCSKPTWVVFFYVPLKAKAPEAPWSHPLSLRDTGRWQWVYALTGQGFEKFNFMRKGWTVSECNNQSWKICWSPVVGLPLL